MLNNILNLEGVTVLSKEQQRKVSGGAPGTCNALITNPATGKTALLADVNKATVDDAIANGTAAGYRVQWCCKSCADAPWLGNSTTNPGPGLTPTNPGLSPTP